MKHIKCTELKPLKYKLLKVRTNGQPYERQPTNIGSFDTIEEARQRQEELEETGARYQVVTANHYLLK